MSKTQDVGCVGSIILLGMAIVALILLQRFQTTPQGDSVKKTSHGYVIKTIEGCEYIEFDYGIGDNRVYSLTHKGNCPNPIHCRRVEK